MIRSPNIEDALGIATVHVLSWQQAYQGMLPDDYLASLSIDQRTQMWKSALERFPESTIVYERGDQIIGFSNFGKSRDEDASEEMGEIRALYVLEAYWSQGIGYQLLAHSLLSLKEQAYPKVALWVLDTNQRAINFYQKMGFQGDGTNKVDDRGTFSLNELRMVKVIHS